MNRILVALTGVVLVILPPAAAHSEDLAMASIHGRHAISLRLGLFNHGRVESSAGAGGTTSRVNGFGGHVSYAYGFAPEWTVGVSVGALDTEVLSSTTPGNVASRVASVVPILLDVRWFPLGLAMGESGRPFVGAGAGPYIGSATNSIIGTTVTNETVSETVPGLCAYAGVDWHLGPMFRAGLSGGYHFVGVFDQPIGRARDYSGAEFLVEFGLLFGAMP